MSTKLSKESIGRAIDHIARFGDTDVFPHLIEIAFLKDKKNEIVEAISNLDLDNVSPIQEIEALSPKSRNGFRIVHQLNYLDVLLFTASCIEIGDDLEKLKIPSDELGPFAYRFDVNSNESLFSQDHSYKDWLEHQKEIIQRDNTITSIIFTDIADFYSRIYLHRIESILDVATPKKGVKKFIEKVIKSIRSKQSHGIPIGCSASRIIAEAVLADSDSALRDEGVDFTRFVDDYRIFVKNQQHAYHILSFLAEHLSTTEGLSLNAQKTRILSIGSFVSHINDESEDAYEKANKDAIDALHEVRYFEETVDEATSSALIEAFRDINLVGMLEREVDQELWDIGRIRAIFRALRLTLCADAATNIIENFDKYTLFVKEIVLLFDELKKNGVLPQLNIEPLVLQQLTATSAHSVATIRAWLYEFQIRGIIKISNSAIAAMREITALDKRQIYLMHGVNNNVNFFRRHKTKFEEKSLLEKGAFIIGATCLPKDEFESWISAVKPNMHRPLDHIFCDWAKSKSGKLRQIIESITS